MKTLHLNLRRKWFDMILSGEKLEEYREMSVYWSDRFLINHKGVICKWDTITFSNGYAKNRNQFVIELKEIKMDMGKTQWGAELHKIYFVLYLGKIINEEQLPKI